MYSDFFAEFTVEANFQDVSKLHSWTRCSCDEFPASRVPICLCQIKEVSPFLQIRWKRLVIDEGHVSATISTSLVPFAKLLSVERRWIVTGTPTTNLLGLSFGTKSSEMGDCTKAAENKDVEDREKEEFQAWEVDGESDEMTEVDEMQMDSSTSRESTRIWSKYDREDLNKLGSMIAHFIAVPKFHADPRLVASHVIEPLLDGTGPRPGSIQVLNQVMDMVMIRHR
jgi:hypothetical protein